MEITILAAIGDKSCATSFIQTNAACQEPLTSSLKNDNTKTIPLEKNANLSVTIIVTIFLQLHLNEITITMAITTQVTIESRIPMVYPSLALEPLNVVCVVEIVHTKELVRLKAKSV